MSKIDLLKRYESLLTTIYGKEVVNFLFNADKQKIHKSEKKIEEFYGEYKRKQNNKLNGCIDCYKNNPNFTKFNQDFPGWRCRLDQVKYIVIGLEVTNNPGSYIHIAYSNYPNTTNNEKFIRNMIKIFSDFGNKSYITDIAKCNTDNHQSSRQNCLPKFKEELKIILELAKKNDPIIIIQGIAETLKILEKEKMVSIDKGSKNMKVSHLPKEFQIEKQGLYHQTQGAEKYHLLEFAELTSEYSIENKHIPIIILPHSSGNNNHQWGVIEKNATKIGEIIKQHIKSFS